MTKKNRKYLHFNQLKAFLIQLNSLKNVKKNNFNKKNTEIIDLKCLIYNSLI